MSSPPPWTVHPDWAPWDMGYRMGGERVLGDWLGYVRHLGSVDARMAYLLTLPTAPASWTETLVELLDPDPDGPYDEAAQARRARELEDLGLVEVEEAE